MDNQRAFLAIALSLLILLGYQFFFAPPPPPKEQSPQPQATEQAAGKSGTAQTPAAAPAKPSSPVAAAMQPQGEEAVAKARDITVETNLYTALISEAGGGLKSFKLKKYKESLTAGSGLEELITTASPKELPLFFSWGAEPEKAGVPVYQADTERLEVSGGSEKTLTLQSRFSSGLELTRTMTFSPGDYLIRLDVTVRNTSTDQQLQGAPYLALTDRPYAGGTANRYIFHGPAVFQNGALEEIKVDGLKKGPQTRSGNLQWVAYEDTYFMTGIIPEEGIKDSVHFSLSGDDTVNSVLAGETELLPPQGMKHYAYTVYVGPKELRTLKAVGHDLDKIVNFGWFDALAKPMLYLLNFLYGYVHNYGVAIILLTVIIKALLWPVALKGMKSMKTLQKLQPKMAKLREKYGNDKERLNREMIQLYQTYKVNPMGGCLPMVLQIPVFFALYKVLLQTIELRHAPFMLWITDLSAPDRLALGFHIPYLDGIPVLTLLMGASMFVQQKMTPTAGDPTQAKMMMWLPVVFTFMFLNFASGLVLYWFVNNLLSIAQQYVINRAE